MGASESPHPDICPGFRGELIHILNSRISKELKYAPICLFPGPEGEPTTYRPFGPTDSKRNARITPGSLVAVPPFRFGCAKTTITLRPHQPTPLRAFDHEKLPQKKENVACIAS